MPKKKLGRAGNVYRQTGREGFVIRWVDSTGRRRSRSLTTATLQEARTALAEEKRRVNGHATGQPLPSDGYSPTGPTVLRLGEITSHVVEASSRAAVRRQQGIVETKLKPHFGSMKLAQVRRADVVRFIHERAQATGGRVIVRSTCSSACSTSPSTRSRRTTLGECPR
jgi:hypothetical protein